MNRWTASAAGVAVTLSAPAAAQEAAGDWFGILQVGPQAELPLVVHIKRDDAGALTGTLDSPAQGARDLPLAEIAVEGGRLTFKVPVVSGSFSGTWDEASKTWRGAWSQGGRGLPLALGVAPATLPAMAQAPPPLPADWQLPSDAEIEMLIAERIAPRTGQGLIVGVLSPEGERIVGGGPAGSEEFTGDTLFEIGSISKLFTALILADMAVKGELSLDDPAEKFLPPGARLPERGRKITLRDLSQHASGLPRIPDNMPAADPEDPYADYTVDQMLEFLGRYQLSRDVGAVSEYSNLGVGLLGYLLTRAAGKDYETLLRERIAGPLGMSDTVIALSPDQQRRLAPGHDPFMRPAKPWSLPTLVGAGGIRSTANDMLKFAAAVLDPDSPLAPAVRLTLAERRAGNPRSEQGLGWGIIHPGPEREILMHDGGTGGYRSVLVIEPAKGRAVVALANSAAEPAAADLGLRVLAGSQVAPTPPIPPAPPPPTAHTEVTLAVAEIDRVVGRYEIAGRVFAFTRDANGLWCEPAGLPKARVYPEAPLRFFWRGLDAHIRFTTDDAGKVTGGEFTLAGQTQAVRRLEP